MITGEELKRMLDYIPDNAVVMLDGNACADIVGIKVETYNDWIVNLEITEGFSVTKDSIISEMFNSIRAGRQ